MEKFTAPSGAKVEIEVASFEDSWNLKQALCEILLVLDLPIEKTIRGIAILYGEKVTEDPDFAFSKLQISDLMSAEGLPDVFSRALLGVMSSKKVKNCIFTCLSRSRYNGEAIRESIFDKAETRQDYSALIIKCIKVNVLPFIPPLHLGLRDQG
jgi:hypothetical protein